MLWLSPPSDPWVPPKSHSSLPSLRPPSAPPAVDLVRSSRPYRSTTEQSAAPSLSLLSPLAFSSLPLSSPSLLLWPSFPLLPSACLVYARPLRRSSCCRRCRVSSLYRSWDGGRPREAVVAAAVFSPCMLVICRMSLRACGRGVERGGW